RPAATASGSLRSVWWESCANAWAGGYGGAVPGCPHILSQPPSRSRQRDASVHQSRDEDGPMATEHNPRHARPAARPRASQTLARWGRPLALAPAVVFVISSAFPVVAGLSHNTASFPRWWGVLDIAIAFLLASLAIGLSAITQGLVTRQAEEATFR